jgi:phosphopantothenoylcysteine decarboxylase
MAKVLLGVTGSVAAVRTPDLYAGLRRAGHQIKVVATDAALYFFDPAAIGPDLVRDADEWPGRAEGRRWQRDDPVLHIELRRWADLLLIAPLDANTLAKLAHGLCDNCLTCVWRAWDPARPVVLAPAMNTLMWQHPLTRRHLALLADQPAPAELDADGLIGWLNQVSGRLRVVPPQNKRLACGDVGIGAMADVTDIIDGIPALTV